MGNGMNKIMHGLYLGNFRDSRDANQLAENKITHILSIHDNARPLNPDKIYLCLQASDMPNQNISQYFSECNDFIHKARLEGGHVLVHCLAGVSRSASIVVAYVMTVTNLTYREALDAVRGARRCASPNFGFQRQLLEFQHERLAQERLRLESKYGKSQFDDQGDCQILLDIFNKSEQQLNKARSEYQAANFGDDGARGDQNNSNEDANEKSTTVGDVSTLSSQAAVEKVSALSSEDCAKVAASDADDRGQAACDNNVQDGSVSSTTENDVAGLVADVQKCCVLDANALGVECTALELTAEKPLVDGAAKISAN